MDEIRFDEQVAVVTGAGGGLGREYALLLAARGAKVVVNDLGGSADGSGSDTTPAQQVVDEIISGGGAGVPDYHSVSDPAGARQIVETALKAFGRIDILINNAGILRDKSITKMTVEDYQQVMEVHLNGTFYCSQAAFPHMKEQNYGRIVGTSSSAGVYGNFGQTNYGAAKMGILGLMTSLQHEGARYNILANTIIPVAGTRMTAAVMPPEVREKLRPEQVAPLVAWLCSAQCSLSGKVFTAGGGYFSRVAITEAPGVVIDTGDRITVEDVAAKTAEIMGATGFLEHDSAIAQTSYIFGKI